MRLFISYARVDKPYCVQIAETLDAHEIWYDQRLYAGQQWWDEIKRRLDWCEGFVYLLSPDSVASEYCQKEFLMALKAKRAIFPVVIHEDTPIPDEIRHIHYADLSNGLTPAAVKTLLNSIHVAELSQREHEYPAQPSVTRHEIVEELEQTTNLTTVIERVAEAMEAGNFDAAVYVLNQALASNEQSRFIDLGYLREEAENALERQTYEREAEREYRPIAELAKRRATRRAGCRAFQEFRQDYPYYDPDQLARYCESAEAMPSSLSQFTLSLLEWCEVPGGMLSLPVVNAPNSNHNGHGNHVEQHEMEYIEKFYMSKYPITNAQFQRFLDAPDGYTNMQWWEYAPDAYQWRKEIEGPTPSRFHGDDRPRENVTWYEAMAFCKWLSARTNMTITLPTDKQWQRAARGNDNRLYPWGNTFNVSLANTAESKIRKTTPVTNYLNATSPFGICDLAGNIWEWCLHTGTRDPKNREGEGVRAIFGGSFISDARRAQTTFHFNLNPEYCFATIGFRVIAEALY
jgi:formylglycine-generating enzyme required for sulfatase activity